MDNRTPASRDKAAQLKLMGGALRLAEFTARDLAEHAGVKRETARAFADDWCKAGFFRRFGKMAASSPAAGRPANRYGLLAKGEEEIMRRLVEVRRAAILSDETGPALPSPPDDGEDFSPLALLESSLAAVAAEDFSDDREKQELFADARASLTAAATDLRAMIARRAEAADVEDFAARLRSARMRLATLSGEASPTYQPIVVKQRGANAQPPPPPIHSKPREEQPPPSRLTDFLPALASASADIRLFLEDWTASLPDEAPSAQHQGSPDELLDAALALPAGAPGSIFGASFTLMRSRGIWDKDWLASAFRDRIAAAWHDPAPTIAAQLAVAAAVFDRVDLIDSLVGLLVQLPKNLRKDLDREAVRSCNLALARLARPRSAGDSTGSSRFVAAAACQYLLAREIVPDAEQLAILGPAALLSRYAGRDAMMQRFAKALFDDKGLKAQFKSQLREGVLAANMTLTFQENRFVLLKQCMQDLLAEDSGRGLLLSLSSPEHGALLLDDKTTKKHHFRIEVGQHIANYLGYRPEPEIIGLPKAIANKMSNVLTDRAWISQPAPPDALIDGPIVEPPGAVEGDQENTGIPERLSFSHRLACAPRLPA
jgi:hypothetical protein